MRHTDYNMYSQALLQNFTVYVTRYDKEIIIELLENVMLLKLRSPSSMHDRIRVENILDLK